MKIEVKIRFNTNFPKKHDKKWRVIIQETQHYVDEVELLCKSYSSEDVVIGDDGKEVVKYHISCKPKNVSFITRKGVLKAVLK
jgi:hypothetical protein